MYSKRRPNSGTNIGTLDSNHRKFVKKFKQQKKEIPKLQHKIKTLENELKMIENKHVNDYTIEDIERKSEIKQEIKKINSTIHDVENNVTEMEYYANISETITKYYDLININELTSENLTNSNNNLENIKKKEVELDEELDDLDRVNQMYKKDNVNTGKKLPKKRKRIKIREGPTILDCLKSGSMESAEKINKTQQTESVLLPPPPTAPDNTRASLLHEFKLLIDPEYITDINHTATSYTCDECEIERVMIPNEGRFVCPECGECIFALIETDMQNQKDSITGKPGYPYKRINHFNEWLAQFQAKENTEIPEKVYQMINKELKKMCFFDLENLSYQRVKKILKNLHLTQYYEHVPYIISKINGLPPPTIGQKMENRLRNMFLEIQEPFHKHCPPDRTNFLSYSYVLHKLCQLLELDDFTKCFQLLKSRDKLRQQDKTWEKICEDLMWEYYPSV
jgi:hypothetical protein